jgi:hypothetical protein
MPDLNAASVEAAMKMVAGTARSMGIVVEDLNFVFLSLRVGGNFSSRKNLPQRSETYEKRKKISRKFKACR